MMVTVGSESVVQPLLSTLDNKASKIDDKIDAYNELTRLLSSKPDAEHEDAANVVEDVVNNSSEAVRILATDLSCDENELIQASLQSLGMFLHHNSICSSLSERETKDILNALCDTIHKTTDKVTCTRAMWCLARQDLNKKILEEMLHSLLSTIEHGQCQKNFQSATVELEGLNVIIRLLEQLPIRMVPHAGQWGKLVYPLLLHHVAKVRERALMAMDIGKSAILHQREELANFLLPDLKAMLISEMEKLMKNKQEVHVLKVWSFYVQLLGKSLHGGGLINQILPIVELGFKNSNPNIKVAAYKAWECLIDNFALNPEIIGDHKRVKLIMQVFRINNTKLEMVALEKLRVWLHFVIQLKEKATLYFEQVCAPLLNYCFFGTANPALAGTPGKPGVTKTPNSKLAQTPFASPATPGSAGSAPPTYKSVQCLGAQVLSMMISRDNPTDSAKPKYTIPKMNAPLVTSTTSFTKHSFFILNMTKGCILSCGNDLSEALLQHLWHSIVSQVQCVLEEAQKKDKSSSDVFTVFLGCFRELVESQAVHYSKLLKMFNGMMTLPSRVMSSSAYSIGGIMHGCPAQSLMDLLFSDKVFAQISDNERFYILVEKLVGYGMNSSDPLGFCQSTISSIEKVVSSLQSKQSSWRLWSALANPLLEHIMKSNEVNQGNNLEHDFSCMYSMLLFPITKIPSAEVPAATEKSMMITWTELYKTFARLSAMVANAEENIACEELSHEVANYLANNPEKLEEARFLTILSQMCMVMVDGINFASITPAPTFNFAQISPSPAKKRMKKRGTLGCLNSLVTVVDKTMKAICTLDEKEKDLSTEEKGSTQLQLGALNLVHVLSALYKHVDKAAIIMEITSKLAVGMGYLIQASGKKNVSKIASNQVNAKIEKLWMDICTCIQGHLSGSYNSEFLADIAPVLEATFSHQKRPIKTQTVLLWNVTFGKSGTLEYPDSLKPVLSKVKEKTHLSLPGWESVQVSLVEDSVAASQMSMAGESQVPLPNVAGIKSPRKPIGSFLTKPPLSPQVERSPLKVSKNPTPQKTRRKLDIDVQDLSTQDFVVIKPSPQKKRVLTDHQKDMLKEKQVIPALYSNADASLDISAMNQFSTDTQMSESDTQSPTETPTAEITPFPTFGKSISSLGIDKKKEIKDATAADQKTPETETSLKPQRRASSRKVRFTGDTDDERSNGPTNDVFQAKIKAVRKTLESSQDIDEISKSVESDKAAIESQDDDIKDLAEPMETDDVGETVADSVAMSEEILLTASETTKPASRLAPRRKWSDQSTESSQLSECSKEVANICASSPKAKPSASSVKASAEEPMKSKRSRGRPPKSRSPEKKATPGKKATKYEEINAIDKFLIRSAEKLRSVGGPQKSDNQDTQEESQPKASEADPILVNDTEDQSSQSTPTKQVKIAIVDETPVKGDGDEPEAREADDSPNEIPDSQASSGSLTTPVFASKMPLSPLKEHDTIDAAMLEIVGLTTPTKAKSPSQEPPRSPIVHLVRLSQQDIANYSPKRNKFKLARASSFSGESGSTAVDKVIKQTRIKRRGSLIGMGSVNEDAPDTNDKDLLTLVEKESSKVLVVEVESSQESQEEDMETGDGDKEDNGDIGEDIKSVSQIVDSSVVPDSAVSVDDSQATIVPRHRRRRSAPTWLKDMDTSGSEVSSQEADSNVSSSQPVEPSEQPKGKRGRKKKIDLENSEGWSQEGKNNSSPQSQDKAVFKADFGSTLADVPSEDSQSQTTVVETQAQNDNSEETVQLSQESSKKGKRRGRRSKVKIESSKSDNLETDTPTDNVDSTNKISKARAEKAVESVVQAPDDKNADDNESQENPSVNEAVETPSQPDTTVPSSQETEKKSKRRGRPPKVKPVDASQDSSSQQVAELSEHIQEKPKSTRRRSRAQAQEPDSDISQPDKSVAKSATNFESSEDVPLFTEMPTTECKIDDTNTNMEVVDETSELSQDIFAVDKNNASTPAKMGSNDECGTKKGRRGRKRADPKKLLEINMKSPKSPLIKRLRSQKPHLRTRALNRSLDSLQPRQRKSSKTTSSLAEKSKDDLAIEDVKAELEELAKEDSEASQEETDFPDSNAKIADTSSDKEPPAPDTVDVTEAETDGIELPSAEPEMSGLVKGDSPEERVSRVMDDLNSVKEPTPAKQSPPKKGKPFDMPDTPTSTSRSTTMSRASMILQRARMMFVKPSKSPPSLRARSLNRASASDSKLVPRRAGILKSPNARSPSAKPMVHAGGSPISNFRPIQMPRIYSPSASPSAGILRKRRLSGDESTDSPSPPMKQRRVCFNDKVQTVEIPKTGEKNRPSSPRTGHKSGSKPVNRCLSMPPQNLPQSPLVPAGTSRVVNEQSKYITTHNHSEVDSSATEDQKSFGGSVVDKRKETQSQTQMSQSESSEMGTQECHLNLTDPVFPDLVNCDSPVDQVLPQLTTSVWIRGLEQLARSKKIHTVGHLSSLTEKQVHGLPIKSPKVATIKKALQGFADKRKEAPTSDGTEYGGSEEFKVPVSPVNKETPSEHCPSGEVTPVSTSPMALPDINPKLSPTKQSPDCSVDSDGNELLNDIHRLEDDSGKDSVTGPTESQNIKSPMDELLSLSQRFNQNALSELPSNQLVDMHLLLTDMMGRVMIAMKDKCKTTD